MTKNIFFILIFAILSIAFTACSSPIISLSSDAKLVRIVTIEPDSSCKYLGEVYGYQNNVGAINESEVKEGAINDTKNKAYKIGGDTVYFLSNQNNVTIRAQGNNVIIDDSYRGAKEANIVGLVYKCNQ